MRSEPAGATATGRIRNTAKGDRDGDRRSDILLVEAVPHEKPLPPGETTDQIKNHTYRHVDALRIPPDPTDRFPFVVSEDELLLEWQANAVGDFDGMLPAEGVGDDLVAIGQIRFPFRPAPEGREALGKGDTRFDRPPVSGAEALVKDRLGLP